MTKQGPILTMTSDQGSNLFAAYMNLVYTVGLRLVYFPDINHIESNVESGIFQAINFEHLTEKSLFLAKLHHGPQRSEGRWHTQIKNAFQVSQFLHRRRSPIPACMRWMDLGLLRDLIMFRGRLIPLGRSVSGLSEAD